MITWRKKLIVGIQVTILLATMLLPLSISVSKQPNQTIALSVETQTAEAQVAAGASDALASTPTPSCINFTNLDIVACVAQLAYVGWWITQWITQGAALLQDYFVFYSIQDVSYRTAVIENGWVILRDISNLVFIFALLYIAIGFILNLSTINPKSLLVTVIAMATLINFSLFLSRVVIDMGNILAFALYDQITITAQNSGQGQQPGAVAPGAQKEVKSIGLAFVALSNPQKMFAALADQPIRVSSNDSFSYLIITVTATIFNIGLIVIFLKVAFMFVKRVIGLYFAMIFSPIAFASKAFPKAKDVLDSLAFGKWWKTLLGLSLMAPIYMLFLYLAVRFLSLGVALVEPGSTTDSAMNIFLSIALPFVLAYMFLDQGAKYAAKATADIAKGVDKALGAAVGIAGLVATGGVSMLGRSAVSMGAKAAKATGLSKAIAEGKTKGGLTGRLYNFADKTGRAAQNTSFDMRKNFVGKQAQNLASRFIGTSVDFSGNNFKETPGLKNFAAGGAASLSSIDMAKKKRDDLVKAAEKGMITGNEKEIRDAQASRVNTELATKESRRTRAQEIIDAENSQRATDGRNQLTDSQKDQLLLEILRDGKYRDVNDPNNVVAVDDKGALSGIKEEQERMRRYRSEVISNSDILQSAENDALEKERNRRIANKEVAMTDAEEDAVRNKVRQEAIRTGEYTDDTGAVRDLSPNDASLRGVLDREERMQTSAEFNAERAKQFAQNRREESDTTLGKWARTGSVLRTGGDNEADALSILEKKYGGTKNTEDQIQNIKDEIKDIDDTIFSFVDGTLAEIQASLESELANTDANDPEYQQIQSRLQTISNIERPQSSKEIPTMNATNRRNLLFNMQEGQESIITQLEIQLDNEERNKTRSIDENAGQDAIDWHDNNIAVLRRKLSTAKARLQEIKNYDRKRSNLSTNLSRLNK